MKKVLFFLIALFICGSAYAIELPDIDLIVTNENGVSITDNEETYTLPFQTKVKLLDTLDGKDEVLVEYDSKSLSIKKSDVKPAEEVFAKERGYVLPIAETIKVFNKNGLNMYKGPSSKLYDGLDKVIPVDAEITYNVIDNSANTTLKYAYVTYDGISGWTLINLEDSEVAKKEINKIMVINPKNIELKDNIKGDTLENDVKENTILEYNYLTKYQYNVLVDGRSLWLSITNNDAIAYPATIPNANANIGDMLYEEPNGEKSIYEFKEVKQLKPLFYYNNYYYIDDNGLKGWLKQESIIENGSKIDVTVKEETITPGETEEPKEEEHRTPTKIELIIIIGLSVLLLLSLTSLIAVVLMNKKNGGKFDKEMTETNNSDSNN